MSDTSQRFAVVIQAARSAWPDLALDEEAFQRFLAERAPDGPAAESWLKEVHAADLYLSCACALGVPGAIEAFERSVLRHVPAVVARIDRSPAFAEEVSQILRERLFVPSGPAPPKIAGYAGKSDIASWVRTAALRTALNLRRSRKGDAGGSDDDLDRMPAAGPDPEAGHIKAQYQQAFKEVVKEALGALPADQRSLLRLYFVDGLNLEQLAVLFQVTPSAISRRLTKSRNEMADRSRRLLKVRLQLSTNEMEGAVALLRSQLDLSIAGLLREDQG